MGILNPYNLRLIVEHAERPGDPRRRASARRPTPRSRSSSGCDAVLCASAISRAEDPVAMARAIRARRSRAAASRGGAGRIPRRLYAEASTPESGVPEFG